MMIYFLTKFFKNKQYADEFAQGRIFANRLSTFKETQSGDMSGRMDRHEGTVAWLQPDRIIVTLNGHEIQSEDFAGPVLIQMNWLNYLNVVCLHAAHTGELELASLPKDSRVEAFRQKLLVPNECLALGEYAVVVQDVAEFVKRMHAAAQTNGYLFRCGLVKYYDPETYHGHFSDDEAPFRKQDQYSFQREFRFVIVNGSLEPKPITIDIGDISDIAMQLHASELNGEKLFGGHLELHEKRPDRSQ